jgi:hypothetical protein
MKCFSKKTGGFFFNKNILFVQKKTNVLIEEVTAQSGHKARCLPYSPRDLVTHCRDVFRKGCEVIDIP